MPCTGACCWGAACAPAKPPGLEVDGIHCCTLEAWAFIHLLIYLFIDQVIRALPWLLQRSGAGRRKAARPAAPQASAGLAGTAAQHVREFASAAEALAAEQEEAGRPLLMVPAGLSPACPPVLNRECLDMLVGSIRLGAAMVRPSLPGVQAHAVGVACCACPLPGEPSWVWCMWVSPSPCCALPCLVLRRAALRQPLRRCGQGGWCGSR